MTNEILKIMNKNKLLSIDMISQQLNASPQIIEAVLDDLTRRGYLKTTIAAKTRHNCHNCRRCSGSSPQKGTRIWEKV